MGKAWEKGLAFLHFQGMPVSGQICHLFRKQLEAFSDSSYQRFPDHKVLKILTIKFVHLDAFHKFSKHNRAGDQVAGSKPALACGILPRFDNDMKHVF